MAIIYLFSKNKKNLSNFWNSSIKNDDARINVTTATKTSRTDEYGVVLKTLKSQNKETLALTTVDRTTPLFFSDTDILKDVPITKNAQSAILRAVCNGFFTCEQAEVAHKEIDKFEAFRTIEKIHHKEQKASKP